MKLIFKIVLLLLFSKAQSQNIINCDSIKNGVIDKNLYQTLENGKIIFKINLKDNKIFLIRNIANDTHYYVTRKIMKKIKKCKCDGIIIDKPIKKGDLNAPKIIRD